MRATAFALLDDYGLPVVRTEAARSRKSVLAAARRVGWPVALKTDAPGVQHKSDVGGVALGLTDEAALTAAYDRISQRLGPQVVVSAMAPGGVELALGLVRDPMLGPVVLVAAGGVLVELLDDRAVLLPPFTREAALRALDRLRVTTLLNGFRGSEPADLDAVADAVTALGLLAVELGDDLAAVDVNPVFAGPAGVVAVDVLIERRLGATRSVQQGGH